jgi:hypothetical protein
MHSGSTIPGFGASPTDAPAAKASSSGSADADVFTGVMKTMMEIPQFAALKAVKLEELEESAGSGVSSAGTPSLVTPKKEKNFEKGTKVAKAQHDWDTLVDEVVLVLKDMSEVLAKHTKEGWNDKFLDIIGSRRVLIEALLEDPSVRSGSWNDKLVMQKDLTTTMLASPSLTT